MVIVFSCILYYTKTNLFSTVSSLLYTLSQGGVVDSSLITRTSQELDQINLTVLMGMVVFSVITGVLAAHITLVPTRNELSQRKKFITAIAHELRTPLAVLRTSNEVALYDLEDIDEMKKVISGNIEETKHIANILNNLVIFSRVGATESFRFERTDVRASIAISVKKLEKLSVKHGVHITTTKEGVPQILANTIALEQVFYNVIKNAIVYSKKEGGVVLISLSADTENVTVTIADAGIGMEKKNMQHIFEPFFRIHPDDAQSAGSGLGLALVYEIMKLHNGRISVQSTPSVGTTCTLVFPIGGLPAHQEKEEHKGPSTSLSFE